MQNVLLRYTLLCLALVCGGEAYATSTRRNTGGGARQQQGARSPVTDAAAAGADADETIERRTSPPRRNVQPPLASQPHDVAAHEGDAGGQPPPQQSSSFHRQRAGGITEEEDEDGVVVQADGYSEQEVLEAVVAHYEAYKSGSLMHFRADAFDMLLARGCYERILYLLSVYARDKAADFAQVVEWVERHAEEGHVPLLYFAATIYLRLQAEPNLKKGLLYITKMLLRTAQDICIDMGQLKDRYEWLKRECYSSTILAPTLLARTDPVRWPSITLIFHEAQQWLQLFSDGDTGKGSIAWCYATTWCVSTHVWNIHFKDIAHEHNRYDLTEAHVQGARRRFAAALTTCEKTLTSWHDFFEINIEGFIGLCGSDRR